VNTMPIRPDVPNPAVQQNHKQNETFEKGIFWRGAAGGRGARVATFHQTQAVLANSRSWNRAMHMRRARKSRSFSLAAEYVSDCSMGGLVKEVLAEGVSVEILLPDRSYEKKFPRNPMFFLRKSPPVFSCARLFPMICGNRCGNKGARDGGIVGLRPQSETIRSF
jgi:hypothetical protein